VQLGFLSGFVVNCFFKDISYSLADNQKPVVKPGIKQGLYIFPRKTSATAARSRYHNLPPSRLVSQKPEFLRRI
jgi:hypothetical protein